jgi:Ca2+-binding RTX toxin-like protein
MAPTIAKLYLHAMAQQFAESYLNGIDIRDRALVSERLRNGNNYFLDSTRPSITPPDQGKGGTRMTVTQRDEALDQFDIIDHLPNQSTGFSATLLRNKTTREYTLAFRSTEYRDIKNGGDAERDSARGAAGDIAFNGMALGQVSSMQKYWNSLLDGSRVLGATPDNPLSRNTEGLRATELSEFRTHVSETGGRLNVSGYSLGGHLATMFSILQGERVASLYLFNSSGAGRLRDGVPVTAYREALAKYEQFMQPGMEDLVATEALSWASRASLGASIGVGVRARVAVSIRLLGALGGFLLMPRSISTQLGLGGLPQPELLPMSAIVGAAITVMREQARRGVTRGADGALIRGDSAQHFLASLFATEALEGTYGQTLGRLAGRTYPSLKASGAIPAHVQVFQVSGKAAQGAPSTADFGGMRKATDWNIVADSGVRASPDADLISVYIENQPALTGLPLFDSAPGDFGTTHSITLIVDSLAVTRMLQRADPNLTQAAAESIMQAASSLRREAYSAIPGNALTEHDTLERVVDALGRALFDRNTVDGIDWRANLRSANGVTSYGELVYRDPLHQRIRAIEEELATREGLSGVRITSLAGLTSDAIAALASERSPRGAATRYALKELNPFIVEGTGLNDSFGRNILLEPLDAAGGGGAVTAEWIRDRADFLALKLRLNMADRSYEVGDASVLYASTATGDRAFLLTQDRARIYPAPDRPSSIPVRPTIERDLIRASGHGEARLVTFGTDGDPFENPSTTAGGMDVLRGAGGADRIFGENGNDLLTGAGGDDYLEGGRGDDTLAGNTGADTLAGGLGFDTYLWATGDGADKIVEAREASGEFRGRIVIRTATSSLYPRHFKRDQNAAGEAWRSPDRTMLLTHGERWILSFSGGELDLGTDLRPGDFGFQIEGAPIPRQPTIIFGALADRDVFATTLTTKVADGDYGHDRVFADTVVPLDVFLSTANAPATPGIGYWLSGGPGEDLIIASAANDILFGGGGADTIAAGPGDDLVDADVWGLPNNHDPTRWTYAGAGFDAFHTEFVAPGFTVTSGGILDVYREQLVDADDVVHGGSGNDRIYGAGGNDLLFGDPGNDLLAGGEGSDALFGGPGDDRLTGELHGYAERPFDLVNGTRLITYPYYVSSYGDDILDGGEGNDELAGEGGTDVLFGGEGADTLYGDLASIPGRLHGPDILDGGAGDDNLIGHGGADMLLGGSGNDRLYGDHEVEGAYHGADTLDGEDGDDLLVGAGGRDQLAGGPGADTLIGDAADLAATFHDADTLDGGDGNDILVGYGGADELFGGAGDDQLHGDDPDSAASGDADFLDGGADDDVLRGQGGDDRLHGGTGADTLFGDTGNDTLAGGPDPDVLNGGAGDDTYELTAGDGADRIVDSSGLITLVFLDGVELGALRASRVPAGGASSLTIQYGGADSVTFDGFIESSRIRIQVGDGIVLSANELDGITQAPTAAVIGNAGSELLAADTAGVPVFGLNGDDLIVGSDSRDVLRGGLGDDWLFGLAGDDALAGDEGADALDGGPGNDSLTGGTGDDIYVFASGEGKDVIVEHPQQGNDTIEFAEGVSLEAARLRRNGNDLVVTERGGAGRLFVRDWYSPGREADPGIDAIAHDAGTLDIVDIRSRVIADRTLRGTTAPDTITGDEFDDIIIGGAGDDTLAGLEGDDRYLYTIGDGSDRIIDTGGYDVLEFGPGIHILDFDIVASVLPGGDRAIVMTLASDGSQIEFDESRAKRIDEFRFTDSGAFTYSELLARHGGLRVAASDQNDVLQGSFHQDQLYGFAGNDTLNADAGADLLVGGAGDDELAGGANDDTYYFNIGDGRDSIIEYAGNEEYALFRGFFTSAGRRAYELDGIRFEAQGAVPGPMDETFNLTLGSVHGGTDTLVFGEGITPNDIRIGLDFGLSDLPYSALVADGAGGAVPGTRTARQVAYVLEVGEFGDAVALRWPNSGHYDHQSGAALEAVPLERFVFGEPDPVTLEDLFQNAGGFSYVLGSADDDRFTTENLRFQGKLGGGPGDDVFVEPETMRLAIWERPNEGTDTVIFGAGVTGDSLKLIFDQRALRLDTSAGAIELYGFHAAQAEIPLLERFSLASGEVLSYADLLSRGIEIPATAFDDRLRGTSLDDRILAGAGADHVDAGAGHDYVDGGSGDDELFGGSGDDELRGGAGADRLAGGPGNDRYVFERNGGEDTITESGRSDDFDTVVFIGVDASEVVQRRQGDDLVFDIAGALGRVRVESTFATRGARIEAVEFADGRRWAESDIYGPDTSLPPNLDVPGSGSTQTTPTGTGSSLGTSAGSTPSDTPPGSGSAPATTNTSSTVQAESPDPAAQGTAPSRETPAALSAAATTGTDPPMASTGAADAGAPASVTAQASVSHPGVVQQAPAPALAAAFSNPSLPPPAAPLEALATGGFVSPGRAKTPLPETAPETITPESVTPDVNPPHPDAPTGEAPTPEKRTVSYAAYWRWMHAQLDAHLARTDIDDLAAPDYGARMPITPLSDDPLRALLATREIGLTDRGAFDMRRFEGLKDGITPLG